jgi:vacuolar protein sorting-associated protein 54
MAGSSSRASMSPTSNRINGGSSLPGERNPMSPGGSDVGSIASAAPSRSAPRGSISTPTRLGNLHGAGLSTLQLALGEASTSSSSKASLTGFNAISTLLNDPKRPQRAIDPSSSRYPALSQSHTELPKVKRSDFEGYINSTKKEWERFQRNLRLGSRGKARLEADDVEADPRRQSIDRTKSSSDPAEVDHTAIIGKKKLPPLSTVPQVFFAEDFDLGNPYTFDLVTERYKAAGGSGSTRNGSAVTSNGYDVALNQMLQEKLSYYSDVVEQHLILEISARSTSFFAALGNLQDLESEAAHCLKRVESLKAELDDKEEGIAKAGLRVIREQAKRREMVERLEAVGILQLLCEKKDLCRLLVQSGEWSEALDVMDLLQNVVQGKEKLQSNTLPPHVDLDFASIASVKAFLPQIEEMREAISTQLQSELMSILSQDLQDQIGDPEQIEVPAITVDTIADTITSNGNLGSEANRASAPSTPIPDTANIKDITDVPISAQDTALQERIAAHLKGLIRTQGVDRAIEMYRDMALKAARRAMRIFLCQSTIMQSDEVREDLATLLEDDEAASGKADVRLSPGSAEAASKLREMNHLDFIDLTRFILMGLSRSIQGVEMQTRVILRVLAGAGKAEAGNENGSIGVVMPQGVSHSLPSLLTSTVSDIGGLTHILSSRLLSLRSSAHINLSLADFLAVFHLCWSFILESESTCNRMIIGLRGVVLNQAKSWLANFHRIRIERAARAVEEEKWNQAETNAAQQKLIELVVNSATADPPSLVVKVTSGAVPEANEQKDADDKAVSKTLMIEERQYFVVGATLDILDMLVEYLKVVINLPLLSTETMGRVVEFAKQFNSRTCQVVLGAGAMRSAGLSNITAKHLALASQSLSVMITLIPYVRETVRRHLSPKQAVMLIEFDKLKRDYQEHQFEIHSKLVAIMSDRLTVHCRGLSNVQWNIDGESTEPVKPAADLAKETLTLYKVLSRFLQASVVEQVIGQVLAAIDKRISAEFRKVDVKEDAAIQKMIVIKTFFDEKCKTLKNIEWSGKEMEEVIEEQKVALERSKVANAPPPPAPEKKENIPAYKPRINIFGRKNQATPGTPSSTRVSIDAAPRNSTDGVLSPVAKTQTETVTETEHETKPNEEVPDTADKPNVPEKDESSETPPLVVNTEEQAPTLPQKDKEEAQSKSIPPTISIESSGTATQPPASPMLSSRPNTPSAPSTPVRGAHDTITSPTPGRLTLQQRLAEAARKRAQGNASRRPPTSEAPSSGVATPIKVENDAGSIPAPLPPQSSTEGKDAELVPVADTQSMVEPVAEPVIESAAGVPSSEATVVESAVEPILEPSTEPASEPAVVESATEPPAVVPAGDPAVASAVESVEPSTLESKVQTASEAVIEPAEETGAIEPVMQQTNMEQGESVSESLDKESTAEENEIDTLQDEQQITSAGDVQKDEGVAEATENGESIGAADVEKHVEESIAAEAEVKVETVEGGAEEAAGQKSVEEAVDDVVDDSKKEDDAK